MSHIQVNSGNYVDLVNPDMNTILIEDIAHSLSNLCRFTGHTKQFYSVAHHSIAVSKIVPHEYALEALLHDATEAYLGDVSSPLKSLLSEYKLLESRLYKRIAKKFNIPEKISDIVGIADYEICQQEKLWFLENNHQDNKHWGIITKDNKICEAIQQTLWLKSPKQSFLDRFSLLSCEKTFSL